jgi:hypothetical protein
LLAAGVAADVYMHNPRGSNDRLNEGNTNRQNAERLFNSQNNAKGGYGVNTYTKPMYFYEGSWLTVEWTNQHACSNENTDCTIIIQYMCSEGDAPASELIRDGLTIEQINTTNYDTVDQETQKYMYGMHEPLEYYHRCEARSRNKGLFIADRNLNGENAQYTRQNNGGTRYGFECQEEHDYYPYWHPTPWKDVAVLTNDRDRCSFFQAESQNVADKGHCEHENDKASLDDKYKAWYHNNEADCVKDGHIWKLEYTYHNMPAPVCQKAPWSRDNHLGNGITTAGLAGHMNHFNMTIPTSAYEPCISDNNCRCVLRLRYNISTTDYQAFGDQAGYGVFVDAESNGKGEDAIIKNNPTLEVAGKRLSHALNTNQIARTFQDRSHMFEIRKRESGVSAAQRIINVNVRGKRGNIVQTYPAVEYDFVPTFLVARQWDYVHFQWVGFDNNPNNGGNNAEGTDGTDRSNICQIVDMGNNHCMCDTDDCLTENGITPLFDTATDRLKYAYVGQEDEQCDSYEILAQRHNNNQDQIDEDKRNCMKLNAADPYFDGGLHQLNDQGTFFYMSSRNNNFSNRSHKATIDVMPILETWAIAVVAIGGVLFVAAIASGFALVHARANPDSSAARIFDRI